MLLVGSLLALSFQASVFLEPATHDVAPNAAPGWSAHLDGCGVTLVDAQGARRWGLALAAYGFAGSARAVDGAALVSEDADGRVTYAHDATLDEWFEQGPAGLQHGFTVHTRPDRSGGGRSGGGRSGGGGAECAPLTLELSVDGDLAPAVVGGGSAVLFRDPRGATRVSYAGLTVFDADGRVLDAGFEATADGLRLAIDERGARYPLTIDPVVQETVLQSSTPPFYDTFGISVAVSGDTIAVVDHNEVEIFTKDGGGWSTQSLLSIVTGGLFGPPTCLALDGDTLIVGVPVDGSAATVIGGDPTNTDAPDSGAVQVFVRSGTNWFLQAYVKASNTGAGDGFGSALALDGDTLVVGAPGEDSSAEGVDGNQVSNTNPNAGAVYVFERVAGTWTQRAYLKASNTDPGDRFGGSVAISGDTILVGATGEDSSATGVGGNELNGGAPAAGAVYAFVRSGASWSQQAYLKASNTGAGDNFGEVALAGDVAVVGAWMEESAATGVDGDQSDNSSFGGAAYIFGRTGSTWAQEAYLKPAAGPWIPEWFGQQVAVSQGLVVVADPLLATGIGYIDAGGAFVYERVGGAWQELATLVPPGESAFGSSLAASGGRLVVGAPGFGWPFLGGAGQAFVYELCPAPEIYCTAKASSAGCLASIGTSSPAEPASGAGDYAVTASEVQSFKTGIVFGGSMGALNLPFHGGTLCLLPNKRGPTMFSGGVAPGDCSGSFSTIVNTGAILPFGLDAGPGNSGWYQYWYRDRQNGPGNLGTALSNAVRLDFL